MKDLTIRKAKKEDFENYYKIKKDMLIEYSKIIKYNVKLSSLKVVKRDFNNLILKRNNYLLFAEKNKNIIGYLIGSIINNSYNRGGYIEDLFVKKEDRKIGVAKKLIEEFSEELVKNKMNIILLDVNIKNNSAKKVYEKLGFKIIRYNMEKKLK